MTPEDTGELADTALLASASRIDAEAPHGVALIAGTRLGPYEIISPLGAGGMGEVYRAHDTHLSRDVAIKTLPPTFTDNPDRIARFRREARILAALNHPNIAAIYGVEKSADVDHLVLELVEGEALAGPLPLARALECARQVAAAIEAAHGKGIVHRDLKPANIKITPDGRVKVLDFGLAKALSAGADTVEPSQPFTAIAGAETMAGHIVGSPPYMSPEQARGQEVDERTDIWAFGCLLYELLTGTRAYQGETSTDTIASVLAREPDWTGLPGETPAAIRELLRRCLTKDASRRLSTIAAAKTTIERAQRGWNRWRVAAIAAAGVGALAIGAAALSRGSNGPRPQSEWLQITGLPDSVSQPALSPDGRSVAFIRGAETFFGSGDVYVKALPDGEPVRLTHDSLKKMSPAFSPDGARIAYTAVDEQFNWDTWVVPVRGGEPHAWLRNASGLVWTASDRVLFSEIRQSPHMGIVSSRENRLETRDLYFPPHEHGMAHRSQLSPDGRSLLLVEMDKDHAWTTCRVVPVDGGSTGRGVGPPLAGCTFAAWSPDGQWMYVTSDAGGAHHIWRQRFPDGEPQQITFGPTVEEGIAMAPDGRSFVTAVALQHMSIWLHEPAGERQISSLEGTAVNARFTPDGSRLGYAIVKEYPGPYTMQAGDVWIADLKSGHAEPVWPGVPALDYDVSDRQVVLEVADRQGTHRLWVAPLDRQSAPQQIPGVEGREPWFGPAGEIFFRSSGVVYRVHPDGTGLRQAVEQPVLLLIGGSPDGRWIVAWSPLPDESGMAIQALPLDGGRAIVIANDIEWNWSADGRSVSISDGPVPDGRSYIVPLAAGEPMLALPERGLRTELEIAGLPGARRVDALTVPGSLPGVYAFYRGTTQRNLYRIPLQ
jgi:eukaryotic-like serine/threonine-protein kinase